MRYSAVVLLILSNTYISNQADAQGTLDWADPCIEQENRFDSSASASRSRADQAIAALDAQENPPPALRSYYVEAIREGLYKGWIEKPEVAVLIEQINKNGPVDTKKIFIESIYPEAVTQDEENELVKAFYKKDYSERFRPQMIKERQDLEDTLNSQEIDLNDSCSPDVVSQILRGTIGNILGIVGSNTEAAKNESGDIAKYIRATSGVSITDIQTHGLQGGPNSFVNEALGGEESLARDIIRVFDVPNWEVDVPDISIDIDTPDIPPVRIPPIKIGDVCIPWC